MTFMRREIELKEVKVEGNVLTFTLEMGPPPDAPPPPLPLTEEYTLPADGVTVAPT